MKPQQPGSAGVKRAAPAGHFIPCPCLEPKHFCFPALDPTTTKLSKRKPGVECKVIPSKGNKCTLCGTEEIIISLETLYISLHES